MRTLSSTNVEARLVEALPWVLVNYPDVDWPWLLSAAKQNDVQNRLGFVVALAREVAEKLGRLDAAETLGRWGGVLEQSRLQKEDTFSRMRSRSGAEVAAQQPIEDGGALESADERHCGDSGECLLMVAFTSHGRHFARTRCPTHPADRAALPWRVCRLRAVRSGTSDR